VHPSLEIHAAVLWAAKFSNPNRQAGIGEVTISAADGKVLDRDLNIRRAQ
jgi:hypothetical protein